MRLASASSPTTSKHSLRPTLKKPQLTRTTLITPRAMASASASSSALLVDRVRGALWGIFIADALSMPAHWFYNPSDIPRTFGGGPIKGYHPAPERHPSSIMSLSNTGGHGRGGQEGRIIGDVINHGKHHLWGRPSVHYHHGMRAGENTLNALCARVAMRSVAKDGGAYNPDTFLRDYVEFMTTPGSHGDTYAESYHRSFFVNWAAGVPAEDCSKGTEGSNTAQIGGFVALPPVVMANLKGGREAARKAALKHLSLTHESERLSAFASEYAGLLYDVATGASDLRTAVAEAARPLRVDLERVAASGYDDTRVIHGVFGPQCYINESYPSVLYLAYRHADSFEDAVLANTNAGGENCHRGAALGALMGAALGESKIPARLIEGLDASADIRREIDAFCDSVFGGGDGKAAAPTAAAGAGKDEL